jgi:hypothetical protein
MVRRFEIVGVIVYGLTRGRVTIRVGVTRVIIHGLGRVTVAMRIRVIWVGRLRFRGILVVECV